MNKGNILIVDDEMGPRESLRMILKPFYTVHIAENGTRALEIIQEKEIDLVTLDLKMSGLQGIDVLKQIKNVRQDIEVIIVTGYGNLKSAVEGIRYGVIDFLTKPFNITEIVSAVHRAMEKKRSLDGFRSLLQGLNTQLEQGKEPMTLKRSIEATPDLFTKARQLLLDHPNLSEHDSNTSNLEFVTVLVEALEAQSPATAGHSRRIHFYTTLLAERLNIAEEDRCALQLGVFLHDLGLLGNISPEERVHGKTHPKLGAELSTLLKVPQEVAEAVRYHHERFDGRGFPEGLSGKKIPLFARMICLAEYFDDLVSGAYNKTNLTLKEALIKLEESSGRLLDPDLVQTFASIIEKEGNMVLTARERTA